MFLSNAVRAMAGRTITFLLGTDFGSRLLAGLLLDQPKVKAARFAGHDILLNIPGALVANLLRSVGSDRLNYFARREQATFDFLAATLRDDDVFYDIGAHIGIHVVVANKLAKLKWTLALEPEGLNFAELCRNIRLNRVERVIALPLAAGASRGYESFHLKRFEPGNHSGCLESYPNADRVRATPERFVRGYTQTMPIVSLDDLVDELKAPPPTVLLMDVDGGETLAVLGMKRTLQASTLRAAIIETSEGTDAMVTAAMTAAGLYPVGERSGSTGNRIYIRRGATT